MTLSQAIPDKTVLRFKVVKTDHKSAKIESMEFPFTVGIPPAPVPALTGAKLEGSTLTITGQNFTDTAANPLKVTLKPASGASITVTKDAWTQDSTTIKIDMSKVKDFPATTQQWSVEVQSGETKATGAASFNKT